jgi:hypothetical protein
MSSGGRLGKNLGVLPAKDTLSVGYVSIDIVPSSAYFRSSGASWSSFRRFRIRHSRLVYRIDPEAILILDVFLKKDRATPQHVVDACRMRIKRYDLA